MCAKEIEKRGSTAATLIKKMILAIACFLKL